MWVQFLSRNPHGKAGNIEKLNSTVAFKGTQTMPVIITPAEEQKPSTTSIGVNTDVVLGSKPSQVFFISKSSQFRVRVEKQSTRRKRKNNRISRAARIAALR